MLQLKGKLNEQTNKNRTLNERDLKILANTKKSAWDNKNSRRQPSNTHYKQDSQKTEHLLEIIDHYKQKMLVAEEEIQNLKRKIHLLEQDVKVK